MLWLAAYLTGFPPVGLHALSWTHGLAPMWSGLYIISTWNNIVALITLNECQCPLGLIPHFYLIELLMYRDLSSLCQCPLGLIPHFYDDFFDEEDESDDECQCPLGLIPHFYGTPSKT